MSDQQQGSPKRIALISGGAGLLVFLFLLVFAGYSFFGALVLGILVGAIVAVILYLRFHRGVDTTATTTPAAPHKDAPEPSKPAAVAARDPGPEPAAEPETDAMSRPVSLEEPDGGSADDLKKIKGIGPKLEGVLNAQGIYHFHQIAAWSDSDVAWADEHLVGFKGRVSRDNWVGQARVLAKDVS